jgi:hypothetical protein
MELISSMHFTVLTALKRFTFILWPIQSAFITQNQVLAHFCTKPFSTPIILANPNANKVIGRKPP